MSKLPTNERGFTIYGTFADSKDSEVRVVESSAIGRPCCWVFCDNESPEYENPHPHLNVEQATKLRNTLNLFLQHAEDPENWRNAPKYREQHG